LPCTEESDGIFAVLLHTSTHRGSLSHLWLCQTSIGGHYPHHWIIEEDLVEPRLVNIIK